LYLYGAWRMRQRGDHWGIGRTAAWLTGLLVIAYATCGGVAVYDTTLFSAHGVQHMLLATVAPIPLALGAPVTLALRTLPLRGRRVLLSVLHSKPAEILTFPLVGFALLIVSMYGLYFTSLYGQSLQSPALHALVHVHFLVVGCLFYWPIIGIDPLPGRLPHWGRLLLLFITFPVHALFGLTLMTYTKVFAANWYSMLDRPWGTSALTDQQNGGGIMWASGELVGALVFVALFIQWSRDEDRKARRDDRRLDRTEGTADDELAAYNAHLARLAAADEASRAAAVRARTARR
jgi:putative copper resistance protein D